MTFAWDAMAQHVGARIADRAAPLDDGQRASLAWIADRIGRHGVVLADEVGTGKTRIACVLVDAVVRAGGRAAVVVPQGLMHQWRHEAAAIGCPEPHVLKTMNELMRDDARGEDAWNEIRPRPDRAEWWLLSHSLRVPLVRRTSEPWRASLPTFVQMELAPDAARADGRTWAGRLVREFEDTREGQWGWNGMLRIAREVAPVVRTDPGLRQRIAALPVLNISSWNNERLLAAFANDGDGRRVTEDLIGLWLGRFDLLVIDEAHKSRGTLDDDEARGASAPVLARLVDGILKQPTHGRRVCMTATPMELELAQWLELLARARCGLDEALGTAAVERLHTAAMAAGAAPDEVPRLEELCAAAVLFTETLAPYVTRRRRDADALINQFRRAQPHMPVGAHPHRRFERVSIAWTDAAGRGSPWLDVLFATECMSQAARGLSRADTASWPQAVRDAYTKLAEGHVSLDLVNTDEPLRVPDEGAVDEQTRGKIARVAYWYDRLRLARGRVAGGIADPSFDPDGEHPRVLAAVQEIERWTLQGEKVLVFGVFLQPLGHLMNVLNVRHALRAADAGRPLAHAIDSNDALMAIAIRQTERLRDEQQLSGVVAHATSPRDALHASHDAYTRIQGRVLDNVKRWLARVQEGRRWLGGDPELERALQDHVVAFVMDTMLSVAVGTVEPTSTRVAELADEYFADYLAPLVDDIDEKDAEAEAARQETVHRALADDLSGRQSWHARLLQGSMRWESRRYLQAAFNRPGASPSVLIAQSQVGREGLNLHKACRVVLQFHAEWNPAILEQQIGRVDRKGSLWEQLARRWLEGGAGGAPAFIEIRQLVFEGTYDAYKWDRVGRRQREFDASLFGALLPHEAWGRVPSDRVQTLVSAAPAFAPR